MKNILVVATLLCAATAFAQSPDNDVDALVGQGFGHLRNNSLQEAEADFQRAIELTPCNVDAAYGLSLVYKRNGKWKESKTVLDNARESCGDNKKALDYLSQFDFSNEIYVTTTYDWVEKKDDWTQVDLTYIHHFRPDINAGVTFSDYKRNGLHDQQLGLSLNKRIDKNLNFEYLGYFSDDPNFLAEQKHHPTLTYAFPTTTVIGAGARLDKYQNGWANVGHFEVRQYVRAFYGEYILNTGKDNFGESVTTSIGKIGYEKENKLLCSVGYSYGDETIDQGGGTTFPGQKVESLFFNLRYFIRPTWGIIVAGGPEYRDNELFRTTGAASIFARF